MMRTSSETEAELEARANGALRQALPWIDPIGIKHQATFSFQLGHKSVEIDGRKSSKRFGRLDILIENAGTRLAVLELKRADQPLTDQDREQGLSYARVIHPRPPIVIVSNGKETRIYATETGNQLDGGGISEEALSKLIASAMKIADSKLRDAISTLMSPASDVWISAVHAATELTLEELTGDWAARHPTFTRGFHISRKAVSEVRREIGGARRIIAVEGTPLIGKSHILRELALTTRHEQDVAVLFVEASGSVATGIAGEVARLLGDALGWRITVNEARDWMLDLARSEGPTLVIAVDGLGLEHEAIRRELEAFTTRTVGARLKFVVEADSAVIDRLWTGETRRKETPFARRGIRVPVEPLDDDEFEVAMEVLRSLGVSFMDGAGKAEEYRQPWVLRSMTSAVLTSGELEQGAVATLPPLLSISLFSHARRQFLQDALVEQAATFARAVLDDYSRRDRSTEVSLRAMHNFMVRKRTMREHADTADIEAMEKSGLVGWTLDNSNRSIAIGRIPELIASELSRLIAAELRDRLGDAEKDADAADWFVNTAANIPLGDVIGAQALLDLAEQQMGISLGFLTGLLEGAPSVRPIKPGTRAVAWLPSIGELDVHMRADGVTEIKKRGWAKGIEFPADEGMQTYSNLSSWLILSHLAGVRLAALEPGSADVILGIADPAILALVGSSPIPLCRPAEDLERSGMPTHRGPEGSVLVCSENGIIEPVTLSLFRFLERERKGADDWLDEACREGSAPLLNRISQALSVLSGMNLQGEPAVWAREWNEGRVEPSLRRALAHQAKPRDDEDNTS